MALTKISATTRGFGALLNKLFFEDSGGRVVEGGALVDQDGDHTGSETNPLPTAPPYTQPRRLVGLNGEMVTLTPNSRLRGIFTFGVPEQSWNTTLSASGDGTASSVDGALTITGGTVDGGITRFESLDHPRYEPDRAFGWATASSGISATTGKVRIGCFTTWEGFFIEADTSTGVVTAYTRRTTGVVAPTPEDHTSGLGSATTTDTLAGTLTIPDGSDITKATLFDMWVQWRGVGEQLCLIDLQEAMITSRLGTASSLWSGNPAIPFAIEVERVSDAISVEFGCVDVSIYDGSSAEEDHDNYSITSGNVAALPNTEVPLLVLQAAGFLAGMACTRDHIIRLINDISCDKAATVRIYQGATVSNANVTWSIPDATRGLVLGIGSATATVSGGRKVFERKVASGVPVNIEAFSEPGAHLALRPTPGTLTTGANRGDPAYGETFVVTLQKTAGGTMTGSCIIQVGSVY